MKKTIFTLIVLLSSSVLLAQNDTLYFVSLNINDTTEFYALYPDKENIDLLIDHKVKDLVIGFKEPVNLKTMSLDSLVVKNDSLRNIIINHELRLEAIENKFKILCDD